MRRHVNEVAGGDQRKHRSFASHSQLAIRITEALTNNVGRIEITCLATIPAHVEPGEQYADYKTSLIKRKYTEIPCIVSKQSSLCQNHQRIFPPPAA